MKIDNSVLSNNLALPNTMDVSMKSSSEEKVRNDFERLWNVISDMNQKQHTSQNLMEDVMTGVSDDHHGAMIALQKSELQMQLAVNVRDKLVQAHNQIINMQI